MSRRDLLFLFGAAVVGIWLNQLGFVYSLTYTTASTAALSSERCRSSRC